MKTGAPYDDDTEWLYEVALATSKQRLFEVIAERRYNENYFAFNYFVLTEIIQGYYFCQYLNRKISLYEMLEKSGDVADAGQDSQGCEFFYGLLNEIDKVPDITNSAGFIKIISDYYRGLPSRYLLPNFAILFHRTYHYIQVHINNLPVS